ncbi:MAG: DNA ligase D [Solirubrobacterales bacterium]|nr:DNA ligase D [Solirubrobacterales bacterium]
MAKRPKPLTEYAAKRDFAATPEPASEVGARSAGRAARFVVQEHHATRLHWDLRLERDGVLVSFAVPNALPVEPGRNHLAVRTEDHPLEYLDFHGEIPAGSYGAGTMTIWDHGTYELLKWEERKVEVHLHGDRVDARYALFPIDKGEDPKDWMIHLMGESLDPGARPMPEWTSPMLATAGELPPDVDADWAYEIKWDGIRAIAVSEPGRLKLFTRNQHEVAARYPELRAFNRALSHHRAILDGEVVAFGPDGRPSFSALQSRMHLDNEGAARRLAKAAPVSYLLFDLLWLDGHDLTHLPYADRRSLLRDLIADAPRWSVPDHVIGHGSQVLEAARQQGLEGVVAKRVDGSYEPGRRARGWRKIKLLQRQELVVAGWVPGEGRRRERIGALVLGVHEDGGLRYAGKVGTGFTEAELTRLAGLLGPLERPESPFTAGTPPREAIWVEPQLLAEVTFAEWTPDGQLRHPSYQGLRDDKEPWEVVRESAKVAELVVDETPVRLSNPDKVLYPVAGFTKRDVADYALRISDVLLPHLAGRALTLKRYPDGVDGKFFYEKNAPGHRPDWVRTARVGSIDYVLCEDRPTLAWLANLADLELHTPMARALAPTTPTMVVFDLDPGEPATIVECCEVALLLEGTLRGLGLATWAKTSGSKGMQLAVPLNDPQATADGAKAFAKAVAELLETEEPGLVVSRQAKALRHGKVLVDWSQNDEHKTTISVYSLRARARPTVSTPVTWEEVRACAETGDPEQLVFTAGEVLDRVASQGDLFAGVLSTVQRLPG